MADITAKMVKTLREITQAGMMECKKYLTKAEGDIELAQEMMRKDGALKAQKKAGRVTAEGGLGMAIAGNKAAIVEVNSETDFVARAEDFIAFKDELAKVALEADISDIEALKSKAMPSGQTVADALDALIAKLGENLQLRRVVCVKAEGTAPAIGSYVHGGRIGVLALLEGGSEELARDIAMHIAAARPEVISPDEMSDELVAKEREIFIAQAESSGKPANIIEKMVEGRIHKFLNENSLVGQPFVKNPDETVGQLLSSHKATVTQFIRYEVGEGIEKKEMDFAEEVRAQAEGTKA